MSTLAGKRSHILPLAHASLPAMLGRADPQRSFRILLAEEGKGYAGQAKPVLVL